MQGLTLGFDQLLRGVLHYGAHAITVVEKPVQITEKHQLKPVVLMLYFNANISMFSSYKSVTFITLHARSTLLDVSH